MKEDTKDDANLVKIQRRLRGALARGIIQRIELRHIRGDGGESVALTLEGESLQSTIKDGGGNEQAARLLAEEILEHAEEEAMTLRGVNRYGVTVYREGDRQYHDRCLFTIRGTAIEDSDTIEESEPANASGLVAQTMRHNEVLAKTSAMGHDRQVRHYESMVDMLSKLVMNMTEKHVKVLEVTEAMLDAKAERDLNIRREEKSDQFKERTLSQLMMVGAPLVSKLMAGKPTAEAAATDNLLITLVSSFKEEQMAALLEAMSPEQRALFLELYQTLKTRHTKTQETVTATPNKDSKT